MNLLVCIPRSQCHLLTSAGSEVLVPLAHLTVEKEVDEQGVEQVVVRIASITIKLSKDRPCLRSTRRKYVFVDGARYLGVTIPKKTADAIVLKFETLLNTFSEGLMASHAEMKPPTVELVAPRSAVFIAKGIEKTSEMVATGLVKSASFLGKGVKMGSEKLQSFSTPKEEPTSLSNTSKAALDRSKSLAVSARDVTTRVANVVESTTQSIAEEAANTIKQSDRGSKLLNSKVALGTLEVLRAGLVAMGNVYEGVVDAGVIVAKDSAEATANFVRHKHGDEVGDAVQSTTEVIENMAHVVRNASRLRPKSILKGGAIHYAKTRYTTEPGAEGEMSQQGEEEPTDETLPSSPTHETDEQGHDNGPTEPNVPEDQVPSADKA